MKKLLTVLLALCLCYAPALAAELTTNGGVSLDLAALPYRDEAAPATVYFISDITPESLVRAYQALGVELPGRVGVKISTGEGANSNYLRKVTLPFLYLLFTVAFAWVTGMIVDLLI